MDTREIVRKLTQLIHFDVDAARAYGHAIKHISADIVRAQLEAFRSDHEHHVQDLQAIIEALGEEPPAARPDARGMLREGLTALRSVTGTEGALRAMLNEEHVCESHYDEALAWDVPVEIREVIARHRADEKRHHAYLDQTLDMRAWLGNDEAAAVS